MNIFRLFQLHLLFGLCLIISISLPVQLFAKSQLPICGTLTSLGYKKSTLSKKYKGVVINGTLLVPANANSSLVKRYHVVDQKENAGIMEMYLNWWICVTKGRIAEEAKATRNDYSDTKYGVILVSDYEGQQSTGERGSE